MKDFWNCIVIVYVGVEAVWEMTCIVSNPHTLMLWSQMVSNSFDLALSCSHTLILQNCVTHYCIPQCILVQKMYDMLGIRIVLVITLSDSHTYLPSTCLFLTLPHLFGTQICLVWVVHKYIKTIQKCLTIFLPKKFSKMAFCHREGEFNPPSSTIGLNTDITHNSMFQSLKYYQGSRSLKNQNKIQKAWAMEDSDKLSDMRLGVFDLVWIQKKCLY